MNSKKDKVEIADYVIDLIDTIIKSPIIDKRKPKEYRNIIETYGDNSGKEAPTSDIFARLKVNKISEKENTVTETIADVNPSPSLFVIVFDYLIFFVDRINEIIYECMSLLYNKIIGTYKKN